jgi:hypothetical protein
MSDVFKARLLGDKVEGRWWWAMPVGSRPDAPSRGDAIYLTDPARVSDSPPDATSVSYCSSYEVPAHMVERVEDIPPEPTEPGTVVYDREGVAWQRDQTVTLPWRMFSRSGRDDRDWRDLRHPLHPYPRAAREEIERLTAERDEATAEVTAESTRFAEVERLLHVVWENAESRLQSAMAVTERADKEKARADELQRRIDRALDYLGDVKPFSGRVVGAILRGEVGQ